jgi:transposase InsO family protein
MSTGGPSERWAIDLTGPHCLSDNNKYIFTAVDTFTKFIVAVPIRNKEAVTVANVMIKEIFLRWGLPLEVLTDQGKGFEAELNLALLKALSVVKLRTGPYTPSTNGMIESWHKVMHGLLNIGISESQRDWSRWLPYIVFCYNCTVHSKRRFPAIPIADWSKPAMVH